ncbi:MAG: helix-turn-helix domain-containing protein [Spirochaetaceae bacterium]|nr:helix-turn-helix domain-containing protein [Spirochaetaceae bacterium]
MSRSSPPADIGAYIRREVLPPGMTVTEAANRLGVGRPALSNLLNGNASLSDEMASRLERAFGADAKDLLQRQATSNQQRRRQVDRAVAVGRFVPPFLTIKARQIEAWADTIDARHLLPVLVRTLIHSTGEGLSRVDFPGHDDAQRPGWDGRVEADAATPWIPLGTSGWELGVGLNLRSKADEDYAKRLSVPVAERRRCTFVFVTPRAWPQKHAWEAEKNKTGDWKAVRAFDASDLEQWLEQSIPGQVWLADRLEQPRHGCETLDRFWDRWRAASDPPMTEEIFAPSIAVHQRRFNEWLKQPGDRPLYVAGDSTEEALAFLACLFRRPEVPTSVGDRAVLFDSPDTLKALASSATPLVPIVRSVETERELASLSHRFPCIVVRSRNSVQDKTGIVLESLGAEAFRQALADMGIEDENADRLGRESGRSPTILRRRLSRTEAIKSPDWARDADVARKLAPMALAGAWHAASDADCDALSNLSGHRYEDVERHFARLRQLDDSPVWSAGEYRGVVSRMDALFAISGYLIGQDITGFLECARRVLSEGDPALDLPEDERWRAARHGKVRTHSAELRTGLCDTLVLLSVHGNNLLQGRLGIDLKDKVDSLIGELLSPLTLDKMLSHHHDLSWYAEAAPKRFLSLLEDDLSRPEPVLQELMKPSEGVYWLGSPRPRRIGLLRALECLAWSPDHFPRVSRILAQLARTNIDDNFGETPFASLTRIYRSWLPQTSAPLSDRIQGLLTLVRTFPDIGWSICMRQIESDSPASPGPRPRWRDYATGFGNGVPGDEEDAFRQGALELALTWPQHDHSSLGDLVERHGLWPSGQDRTRLWDAIDSYARSETDERAKAELRTRINRLLSARGWRWRSLRENMTDADRTRARNACSKLTPRDPVIRHAWMFSDAWVEGLDDATDDDGNDDCDRSQTEERASRRRTNAVAEIWRDQGWNGMERLLIDGDAGDRIGVCTARRTRGREVEILGACVSSDRVPFPKIDGFMQGYLAGLQESERARVLSAVVGDATAEQIVRVFRCSPLGAATWRLLDRQPSQVRKRYWNDVPIGLPTPSLLLTEDELSEMVDRLLRAERPKAAFNCVLWVDGAGERLETTLLRRLLTDLATVRGESEADRYDIRPADLSDALDALDHRAGVTRHEMARLELLHIHALDNSFDGKGHGIPNLERAIVDSPSLFAQTIALVYRRDDGRSDPPDMRFEDSEQESAAAQNADALLKRLRRIPGTAADGTVDTDVLYRWCTEVRRLCSEDSRATVGDLHIGELMAHAPADDQDRRPCGPVCEVMERIASSHVERGFQAEVYNSRGPHWRGMEEGGEQERDLSTTYRRRAQRLAFDYPWVSQMLGRIADTYEREGTSGDSEAEMRKRIVQ